MKISTLLWENVKLIPVKSMLKKKLGSPENWGSCAITFEPDKKALSIRQYKDNWSTGKHIYLINPEILSLNGWCAEFFAYTWRSYPPIFTKDKSGVFNSKKLVLVDKIKVIAEF